MKPREATEIPAARLGSGRRPFPLTICDPSQLMLMDLAVQVLLGLTGNYCSSYPKMICIRQGLYEEACLL